jgi:4a-hydroxytetrahydrobiopterin dehydratase
MTESCELAQKVCTACTPNTPRLTWPKVKKLLADVPHWRHEVVEGQATLIRHFRFSKFDEAIFFVNKVAVVADAEGHHPDIHIGNYNQVILSLTTHAIHDLSENDFIMAAKIDKIP